MHSMWSTILFLPFLSVCRTLALCLNEWTCRQTFSFFWQESPFSTIAVTNFQGVGSGNPSAGALNTRSVKSLRFSTENAVYLARTPPELMNECFFLTRSNVASMKYHLLKESYTSIETALVRGKRRTIFKLKFYYFPNAEYLIS